MSSMLGQTFWFRETTEGLSSLQQHRKVFLPLTRPSKVSSKATFWPPFVGVKGDSVFRKQWCRKSTLCWRSVHQKSNYCESPCASKHFPFSLRFYKRKPLFISSIHSFSSEHHSPSFFALNKCSV